MKTKLLPILLFAPLLLFLVLGYAHNFSHFLWSWGRPSFFNFIYSCVFLTFWFLLLFFAIKRNARRLLKFYLIFWLLSVLFTGALPFLADTALALLMLLASFAFVVPTVGITLPLVILFDADASTISLILVSLIMLLLGFFARRKFTKEVSSTSAD